MYCWGRCDNGQLGLGGIQDEEICCPRTVKELPDTSLQDVKAGDSHTAILSNNGQVYTCGSNDHGQLGHELLTQRRFGQVTKLSPYTIKAISCGANHCLARDEWGKVFSWGSNSHGQLGHNQDLDKLNTPKLINGLGIVNVIQIACGDDHCLVLTKGGQLYTWGDNQFGQLGIGPAAVGKKVAVPSPLDCLTPLPIRSIACGAHHSFIVSHSGAVYAWGKNNMGQLGLGDTDDRVFPTQVRSLRNQKICHVACGAEHTVCLTEEGGVFSFGSGQYGQLGHGSKSDEQLPRKIIELMGTEVTQIECGRKHTLAFVPTRGRLYAFGLGGSGQLGNSVYTSATTPQVVHGPWVGPTGEHSAPKRIIGEIDKNQEPVVVTRIGGGGDQSFAIVSPSSKKIQCMDYRTDQESIATLTSKIVNDMLAPGPEDPLDQDFLEQLEVIFQNPACLNASFLLPSHKPCTSKNDGINMEAWKHGTKSLTKIKNETIKELITTGLTKYILPKLETTPPDVETLRQYVFFPLFSEFENESLYNEVHGQYARSWFSLPPAAMNVVEKWFFANLDAECFLPIVKNYKKIVIHLLEKRGSTTMYEKELGLALALLNILNRINETNSIISYEDFCVPEIADHIELPNAYIHWIISKTRGTSTNDFHICNYPFVFDASAKTSLLQTDQYFQMHNAQYAAMSDPNNIMQLFMQQQQQDAEAHAHIANLICSVRRDNLVEDTLTFIQCVPDFRDFKKPLKVKFDGEEGDDAGGVRKEFFLLLLKEILRPEYGMFKEFEETNTIWFHPNAWEDIGYFFMIGVLCGLAIYNFTIINLPFPLALYKKLLSEDGASSNVNTIEDIQDLSPTLAKGFRELLAYEGTESVEDIFCLNFAIVEDDFGQVVTKELKPGGENIAVTKENREEYVKLYCDHMLNKSVEPFFKAFHAGFHKVCGGRVLDLFHARELMTLVVGTTKCDWTEFENQTDYKNGYDKDHPTIKYFWEVFHELEEEDKRKFLLFLTGTDRVPMFGFMSSKKLTIQKTGDTNYLPVAHTCFNLLDLPEYATKEKLKFKLLQAIEGTQGFGLV